MLGARPGGGNAATVARGHQAAAIAVAVAGSRRGGRGATAIGRASGGGRGTARAGARRPDDRITRLEIEDEMENLPHLFAPVVAEAQSEKVHEVSRFAWIDRAFEAIRSHAFTDEGMGRTVALSLEAPSDVAALRMGRSLGRRFAFDRIEEAELATEPRRACLPYAATEPQVARLVEAVRIHAAAAAAWRAEPEGDWRDEPHGDDAAGLGRPVRGAG